MLKKNVGKCTHYLAEIKVKSGSGESIIIEKNALNCTVLNQSVKRNKELFPSDFMFQLTKEEYENMSSQIVMTSKTKRPNSALTLAFTEHGIALISNVLRSLKARLISVKIERAFL